MHPLSVAARSVAAGLTVATACAVGAAAQQGVTPPPQVQVQPPPPVTGSTTPLTTDHMQRRLPNHLQSQWVTRRDTVFQGFPLFPQDLSGYGAYPTGAPGAGLPGPGSLPPAIDVPSWPAWLMAAKKKNDLPYQVDRAVLVRHADRVWFKTPDEEAFVPLYHWDQTRALVAGSAVEVRQSGGFELLLHGGGRLVALGPTTVTIDALDADRVRLRMPVITRARLVARGRVHEVTLPDGSTLVIPADSEGSLPQSAAELTLTRADEPEWIAGRIEIFHARGRQVLWQSRFGDVLVDPGHLITLFLTPPANPLPAALQLTAATAQHDGDRLRCTAERDDASVVWSGARFTLPAGARLELDPLAGRPFAPAAK